MAFVELRGIRFFYTEDGSEDDPGRRPVLFVHGFTGDSHDWSWQLPHFSKAGRVIALDLRGHGRTTAPDYGYDLPSLTADIAALLEYRRCEQVVAVGHSLGGALVSRLAVERPDLVSAVVAVDPGFLIDDDHAPVLQARLDVYRDGDLDAASAEYAVGTHPPGTPPALATWHARRAAGTPRHVLTNTWEGLVCGDTPFLFRSNSAPYLAGVEQPVLTFAADEERAALATATFTHPASKVVTFQGAGHFLQQERPSEVNSIIDDWLTAISS